MLPTLQFFKSYTYICCNGFFLNSVIDWPLKFNFQDWWSTSYVVGCLHFSFCWVFLVSLVISLMQVHVIGHVCLWEIYEYHQYDSFIYFQLRNKSQYSFIMISSKEVQTIGSILPSIVSHHDLDKSIIIICIATYGNAYMLCGDFGTYFQCILVKLNTLPLLWVKLEHILTK